MFKLILPVKWTRSLNFHVSDKCLTFIVHHFYTLAVTDWNLFFLLWKDSCFQWNPPSFPFSPVWCCLFTRVASSQECYIFLCLSLSAKFSKPCALWQMHLPAGWNIFAVCSLWRYCLCELLWCRPKPSGIPLWRKGSIDPLLLASPSEAQHLASSEKGVRKEHIFTVCAGIHEPQGKEATVSSLLFHTSLS